ncbi:MAG TPA: cytochrome b/b6 domain-containing protein [Terriglobales bacterium]|nr:cytochrome b/b6 domain-containing protein [Terriglobales bacterium]
MQAHAIPEFPLPLSPDQAEAMAQRQIKKHHVAIVLLHWFNAIVWMLELSTGSALIVAPAYRFMPWWYLSMMAGIFGSRANMLRFHIAVGLLWIIVFLVYAIFGFRNYLHQEVLRREIALDHDDFDWLRIRLLRLLGRSQAALPKQGVYNAGQKMFALLVYSAVPFIMITGLIMTFHLGTALVAWSMVLHFLLVGMVVSGLMIHVYMGAVFPEERQAFYSMITGMVNELYAYRHHFKWWREVRINEEAWRQEWMGEYSQDKTLPSHTGDRAPLVPENAEADARNSGEGVPS